MSQAQGVSQKVGKTVIFSFRSLLTQTPSLLVDFTTK